MFLLAGHNDLSVATGAASWGVCTVRSRRLTCSKRLTWRRWLPRRRTVGRTMVRRSKVRRRRV
jgi:hypothetical protein